MKKVNRVLALCMSLILAFSCAQFAYAAEDGELSANPTQAIYSVVSSEEELRIMQRSQIEDQLEMLGITGTHYIRLPGEAAPRNDINDYYTEVVDTKYVPVTGFPTQPTGGVTFNSSLGGTINYTPEGGSSEQVTVSFSPPFGIISISVPLGKVVDHVTDYGVNVPGYQAYRLKVKNTYEVSSYITYKKIWNNDMTGYEWVEYTRGVTKILYSVELTPVAV